MTTRDYIIQNRKYQTYVSIESEARYNISMTQNKVFAYIMNSKNYDLIEMFLRASRRPFTRVNIVKVHNDR